MYRIGTGTRWVGVLALAGLMALVIGCATFERLKNVGQPDKETVLGCIEYCIEENK